MKLKQSNVICEYENILKNKNLSMAPYYFRGSELQKNHVCEEILRYIVESLMKMTPIEALNYLKPEELDLLRYTKIIDKYYKFPTGIRDDLKIHYVLSKCYPNIIYFDEKKWVLDLYNKVDRRECGFPVGFFSDDVDSLNRACACLHYAIQKYIPT